MTLVRQIGGRVLPFGSKYGGLAELAFYIPSNILGRPLDRRIGAALFPSGTNMAAVADLRT